MNIVRVITEIRTCANTSKVFYNKRTELLMASLIKPLKISDGGSLTDMLLICISNFDFVYSFKNNWIDETKNNLMNKT